MSEYMPIVVLGILAIVFGVISLVASHVLAPRRPSAATPVATTIALDTTRAPSWALT